MPDIRRIQPHEREAVLDLIVQAFAGDPQVRWWFDADDAYPGQARQFFGVLLDTRIEGGEVWVADDAAAVAMWIPPGGNLIGPDLAASRYAEVLAALPPEVRRRVLATDERVDSVVPAGPHWYLGVLACRQDSRGQGLAWAVAAPVLAAADRAGVPVVLETGNPQNVAYYTRRGFVVLAELAMRDLAAGAPANEAPTIEAPALEPPTIRVMQRDPAFRRP